MTLWFIVFMEISIPICFHIDILIEGKYKVRQNARTELCIVVAGSVIVFCTLPN